MMRALIAGQGRLPTILAERMDGPLVAALEGFDPDDLRPAMTFRLERLATFIADLKDRGVSEVCFAGAIGRPPLDPDMIDRATRPLADRILAALRSGDDAGLRTILAIFEEAGLAVIAAHGVAPDLLPPAGALGAVSPTRDDAEEAIRADAVLRALGKADVGQSCAVHMGQVLAVEGTFGTDWMLASLKNRPDGRGGLFYKAPKPGQDRRVDLPVIGPGTVRGAIAAGLSGIAIEHDGVLVLDRDEAVAQADAAGIFMWVRRP